MVLRPEDALHYYTRDAVRKALVDNARGREIGVRFDTGFGKRPDALMHPQDVVELARQGATSFHASEERWHNPLLLDTGLRKDELNTHRSGWDLILDIDCPYWSLSKLFTSLFIKALEEHGVVNISVKFSGNKGFHIGVPFESFPSSFGKTETSSFFPDGPRKIALYLLEYIMLRHITIVDGTDVLFAGKLTISLEQLSKMTGKDSSTFIKKTVVHGKTISLFDPLLLIGLDTVLISSRHLYRMPYSLHEKSGLVSIPLDPKKVLTFEKEEALPEHVLRGTFPLFFKQDAQQDATRLFLEAIDHAALFASTQPQTDEHKQTAPLPDGTIIPEECFPPCMRILLDGVEDGRKRTLFILTNFLLSCGWTYDLLEKRLRTWNEANKEPLTEHILATHLRYLKQHKKALLPPNCDKYYPDLGVCKPDAFCATIKNPFQYAKKRFLRRRQPAKRTKRSDPAVDRIQPNVRGQTNNTDDEEILTKNAERRGENGRDTDQNK